MFSLLALFVSLFINATSDPCGDFYNYSCTQQNQGLYDGTGPGNDNRRVDRQLPRVQSRDQMEERLLSVFTIEERNINQNVDALLRYHPGVMFLLAETVGCNPLDLALCPNYPLAVQALKNHIYAEVSFGFGQSLTPSNEQTLALPVALFADILDNVNIRGLVRNSLARVDTALVPLERQNRIQTDLAARAKNSVLEVLRRLPDSPTRQRMIERIQSTQIITEYCNSGRQDILRTNAQAYNSQPPRVNVCLNMLLRTNSDFAILQVLGHELGHIAHTTPGANLILEPLTSCLSRPESTGAPRNSDIMNETFCDWLGAESLALIRNDPTGPLAQHQHSLFANGLANTFPLCETFIEREHTTSASHPPGPARFNLIASQPQLRTAMGCSGDGAPQSYCAINGRISPEAAPPATETAEGDIVR